MSEAPAPFEAVAATVEPNLPLIIPEVSKNISTKEILAKLNPEKFTDDDGNEHDLFTFRNRQGDEVRVVFYSREELPFNRVVVKDNQAVILGNEPKYRKKEEWQTFTKKVQEASQGYQTTKTRDQVVRDAIKENRALFFVENSPTSLIDIALWLGADGQDLREARQKSVNNNLTPRALEILDMAIAGKTIDDSGNVRSDKNSDGEALTILALLGDENANEILNKKMSVLKIMDENEREKQLDNLVKKSKRYNNEPLQLNDLVAVHLTNYLPVSTKEGWQMNTTFDGSGWVDIKDTIHFALNHPVAGHDFNHWDSEPYAIVSPLDKMRDLNGPPTVLNTVDTFYEISPGTKLKLPKETRLVLPGVPQNGELFGEDTDNKFVYKNKGLTGQDVQKFINYYTDEGQSSIGDKLGGIISDSDIYGAGWGDWSSAVITKEEHDKLVGIMSNSNGKAVLKYFTQTSFEEGVSNLFREAGILDKIPAYSRDKLIKQIQSYFVTNIKNLAIRTLINRMGYKDKSGGKWSWGDSWDATGAMLKLGVQMDVPVEAHSATTNSEVVEIFRAGVRSGLIAKLLGNQISPKEYRDLTNTNAKELLPELSQATRRMLYLIGAI